MKFRIPALLAIGFATAFTPAVLATDAPRAQAWNVEHAGSSLGFAGVADGAAFDGSFGSWEAEIAFDPDNLQQSSVLVTIDMTTADSGDPNRDTPLLENDWFATAMYPAATFATTSITSDGSGAYLASGDLTIRDHTEQVELPFTLVIEGDTAMMQGSVTINRQDFGIGVGTWQDRSVAAEVQVNVALTATKG
jgi:polyisoprenoid-binding protein YceI